MDEVTTASVTSASGAAPVAAKPSTSKKAVRPKKNAQPAEHPKYKEMITSAISSLKERRGSSRQAILKYILANYKVGTEVGKMNARVKMALRAGIKNGNLRQMKGSGASGSFRLGEKVRPTKPTTSRKPKTVVKKPVMKKPKTAGKKKTGTSKKTADARKSKSVGKPRKSPAKAAAKKTSKAKVHAKSPAKKVAKKTAASPKRCGSRKARPRKPAAKERCPESRGP